jgi:hypothetical protein
MRCPECHYELTENEKLLCLIPGGHYCPQCWARIAPEPAPKDPDKRDGTQGQRSRNGKSETRK